MTIPSLHLTFVQLLPDRCMRTEEHEAFVTALLGPCDTSISGRMIIGPDRDTQFQTLEVATAAWTRRAPSTPSVSWSTRVEHLEGREAWYANYTHCELKLTGFSDHRSAWDIYEAFRLVLRSKGYRPLFYGSKRLLVALREAGDLAGLECWQAARVAAILDEDPDGRGKTTVDLSEMDLAAIVDVAQRFPGPEAVRLLDLRRNQLRDLPEALRRFCHVRRLMLQHNAFTDGPSADRLRFLFPDLKFVELRECPLSPGVAKALSDEGLQVLI
jgi:hypothetical protein